LTRADTAMRGKTYKHRPPWHMITLWSSAFLIFQVIGCSVEKNHDLLSFFFDGVPDPNATYSRGGKDISQSPTYSIHKPYAEDNCQKCHPDPSEMLLSRDDSSVCLQCHEEVTEQFTHMHGAVVGMACLWCHNPHMSPLTHLLRDQAPKLCTQCHDWSEPGTPIPSEHEMTSNCLECHSGHGGNDPAFLLENRPDQPSLSGDDEPESDHEP
jgi:predicted CXXCH cytochrome family protein